MRSKHLWLAVTADKYELPLCVEDSAAKLAKQLGTTTVCVESSFYKHKSGKTLGRRIVKVDYLNDEGESENK